MKNWKAHIIFINLCLVVSCYGIDEPNTIESLNTKILKQADQIENMKKKIIELRRENDELIKLCRIHNIDTKNTNNATASENINQPDNTRPSRRTTPQVKENQTLNKWSGFRGLRWGQYLDDNNKPGEIFTKLESSDDGTSLYTRTNDKLYIGSAKLEFIHYICYNGCLCSISISAKGYTNFCELQKALFTYYGDGYQDNQFIEKWTWKDGAIYATFEYNSFSETSQFYMLYIPIINEKEAASAKRAKEAYKDIE